MNLPQTTKSEFWINYLKNCHPSRYNELLGSDTAEVRVTMGDQNRLYQLSAIIELDDAFVATKVLTEDHCHIAKITLSELVNEGVSWVLIVISNFKSYLLGYHHGISWALSAGTPRWVLLSLKPSLWKNQFTTR